MTSSATVVFAPMNSPGHINASLGIADRLKADGLRTVFVIIGDPMDSAVSDRGHELIVLDEANPFEDYEIEDGDDLTKPVDEEAKKAQGKTKKTFRGAFKWPQVAMRFQSIMSQNDGIAFASLDKFAGTLIGDLEPNLATLEAAVKSFKPDLIIIDALIIPPFVMKMGVPWVRLHSANPLMGLAVGKLPEGCNPPPLTGAKLLTKAERERLRSEEPQKWQQMLDEWRAANTAIKESASKEEGGSPMAKFNAKHGCPPLEPGKLGHDSPYLNIYMYPAAIDYDQDDDLFDYRPLWFRCSSLVRGAPVKKAASSSVEAWREKFEAAMEGKSEAVLFSLGSIASGDTRLMKRFIAMLSKDQKRLYVVSKGANGHKYELDPNNMIGANYIPQMFFLERVNLVVTHGGNNSLTECLSFGVPLIVMPGFADQLDNAQRIEDLGLGRRLNLFNCTEAELMGAIDETLADSALAQRLKDISGDIRAQDDIAKVCLMVRHLSGGRKIEPAFLEECRHKSLAEITAQA